MYLLAVCVLLLYPAEQELLFEIQTEPEDTLIIEAIFMGYSLGDYFYAEFTDENGDLFTVDPPTDRTPGLGIFLFLHRGELVEVTVVNVLTFVPEAGECIFPMVMDAGTEQETYSQWYTRTIEELGISTAHELRTHFGFPETTEEPFLSNEYILETGAGYRHIFQPESAEEGNSPQ